MENVMAASTVDPGTRFATAALVSARGLGFR
jgi:hypothetical protein